MRDLPDVDVVVPVLNGGERLSTLLAALSSQSTVVASVVVVDNGSTDNSVAVARGHQGVRVEIEERRSSYAARNTGYKCGGAPVVAFVDADCRPSGEWLAAGLAALVDLGCDLVAGRVVGEAATTLVGRYDSAVYLDQERAVHEQRYGATANLFVRRAVLEQLGGFNPSLQSGGDLDFGWRARDEGYSIGYAAKAVVTHAPRSKLSSVVRRAWRQGGGHARVGLLHPELRLWALSPRRLVPNRSLLRQHRGQLSFAAIHLVVEWVSFTAQLVELGRRKRRRDAD